MSKVVENKILDKENDLESNLGEEKNNIEYTQLSMDELIEKMHLLSKEEVSKVSKDIEEIKSVFYNKLNIKKKEANEEKEIINKLNHLEIRFKKIYNIYRKIKSDIRKKRKEEEEKNLKIKKQIIKDIDSLSKEEESIKITFEKFRELQEKWKATGFVPITEKNHLWQTYYHHVELFYDYIKINKDLRDLDFKRNLEEKTTICKKAEALIDEKSIKKSHEKLQELHEHWKDLGPVEKKYRNAIWNRFQDITKKLNQRRNNHFLELKKIDTKRLEEKNSICKKISNLYSEKILSHQQWQSITKACHELEKEWKSLGRLSKENNKLAWKELNVTLNNFYTTKRTFYKNKKQEQKLTLENKLNICIKAEKLKNSTDWKNTGNKLVKLQEEWKNTHFLPGKQSNEIWKRFQNACNFFFNERKKYYKQIEIEEKKSYKEKEMIIKKIETFKISKNSKEDIKKLEEFNSKWQKAGKVHFKKIDINSKFLKLLNSKFEQIGLSKKELQNVHYKNKVNLIKSDQKAINKEKEILNNKIELLKKKINQYENNISYFKNDETTKALFKTVNDKIKIAISDIEELKAKKKMLNHA